MSRANLSIGPANSDTNAFEVVGRNGLPVAWIDSLGNPGGNLGSLGSVFPLFGDFYFYVSSGITYSKNLKTGNINSGTDAALVINAAIATLKNTGGTLLFAEGIYNLNSVSYDSVGDIYYCIGVPVPDSGIQVHYEFIGESGTHASYVIVQQTGVIFNITAAARTAAGSGHYISGVYQLPWVANGNIVNDLVFKNIGVRIPDNQRGKERLFDMTMAANARFEYCNADTAIAPADQFGSGISLAAADVIGFRTCKSGADETVMANCWSIAMETCYQVDTEHSQLYNCHAAFGKWPAKYGAGSAPVYHPSHWLHFQDIHCVNGILLGAQCQLGSRLDLIGYDLEYLTSGTFARTAAAVETNAGFSTGFITSSAIQGNVGIINQNHFFSTGGANFRVNQSDHIYTEGQIYSTTTTAATTGTTKQTLATFTLSAGPQGTDGSILADNVGATIRIKAWGITANNGNNKVVEIDFGGTAIASITSTVAAGVIELEADIVVVVYNSQKCIGKCDDTAIRTLTHTPASVNGHAAVAINLAATTPSASGDFTFEGMTIEYLGGR